MGLDFGAHESIFDCSKLVIKTLRQGNYAIRYQPVGDIGMMIENHPHSGYERLYVCDVPILGFNEENIGMLAAFIETAIKHLLSRGVSVCDGVETGLIMNQDGNSVSLRFSSINDENLTKFIENPPVAFEEVLDMVRAYYLDKRYWQGEQELHRYMGFNEGVMMEQLLREHKIAALKVDDRAYVPNSDTEDFAFTITPEALQRLQQAENYKPKIEKL